MTRPPTTPERPIHGLGHTELASTDPAATRKFLEATFGWSFETMKGPGGDYHAFQSPGGGRGGIRPTQAHEPPGSMSYVTVEDVDAALEKVKRGGGEIVLPRTTIPGMGTFFWFKVPGGPILAAWKSETR
jgi:hypothetical protein